MADSSLLQSSGGSLTTAVAAGSGTADVVVSAYPGRVNRIVITTAGSAALELYDHASASSGARLIWKSGATPAVETDNVTLDLPVQYGIVAKQASGSAAVTISYTKKGSPKVAPSPDEVQKINSGGQYTSYHAAGASGAGAASAKPGRLCKLSVLSSGSAATVIYDNASAASGTKLFTLAANPTVGVMYDIQMPVSAGIYVAGDTNTSALTLSYNSDGPHGL